MKDSTRHIIEDYYSRYHNRDYITPDPIEFLFDYPDLRDREIVAFIASSLAYGRVALIKRSVAWILERIDPPFETIMTMSPKNLHRRLAPFKHRFTPGHQLACVLLGIRQLIEKHGSLNAAFLAGDEGGTDTNHDTAQYTGEKSDPPDIIKTLTSFTDAIRNTSGTDCKFLVADPRNNNACKRLLLFLRWMVRKDEIDPGGWHGVSPARLVTPLDTHMFAVGKALGIINRASSNLKAATEMTRALAMIDPDDPVKFDFSLSRSGIHPDVPKIV